MRTRTTTFFNEVASEWEFDVEVKVIPHSEFNPFFYDALGTVEYNDGSFMSVYCNSTEGFVGVDYDEECNPL